MILAGILLDRPEGLTGAGPWFRPIAGGQRTVRLDVVEDVAADQLHLDGVGESTARSELLRGTPPRGAPAHGGPRHRP